MKTWIKISALLISSLALTACDSANSISGSFYVARTFSFTDKDGKAQSLAGPKSYDAKLNLTTQQTELSVSTGLFSSVSIVVPNNFQDKTGTFSIAASQLNQSFSINADIEENSANIDNSHSESCVYSYSDQRVCTTTVELASAPIANPKKDGDDNGKDKDDHKDNHVTREVCSIQRVANYGSMWVNETLNVTNKSASLNLVDAAQEQLAVFTGSYQLASQVVSRSEAACLR